MTNKNTEPQRCGWCLSSDTYKKYHDEEWGKPTFDDQILFEFIILESFQAGLSWITILKKRENFRTAFDDFEYSKIAAYDNQKVDLLMQNAGIIRSELKIRSAISNANAFINIQREFGSFSNYIWKFVNEKPIVNRPQTLADVPAKTPLSETISKDLKKRGFKFLGPTIVYAYMQAVGMVNDHISNCYIAKEL